MAESSPTIETQRPPSKRYPRWRLLVGFVLLSGAIAHYVSTLGPRSPFLYLDKDPDPFQISAALKPAHKLEVAPGEFSGANVLLITLDTTRADGLACYGRKEVETPALDGLANQGILFAKATAVAPVTLPTHCSIMTGKYPTHHGVRANGFYSLGDSNQTLAETLRDHGYQTRAVISAFVLESQFGLGQGFDTFEDDLGDGVKPNSWAYRQRTAEKTTDRALQWIQSAAKKESPFMLWVHYFDPHAGYDPPSPFDKEYRDNPYLGEIAYVDSQIARIVDTLKQLDLVERTLVVVVGDHGESLGQHQELSHGFLAYEATMRVPFIMSCGKRLGGGVYVDRRVSQVDVLPTVLGMLGVDPQDEVDGVNVLAPGATERPVFCETLHGTLSYGLAPVLGVYDRAYKYLHGPDPELYVLAEDPNEQSNRLSEHADQVERLRQKLIELFGDDLEGAGLAAPPEMPSASAAASLEALGYVGAPAQLDSATERPDPKSVMPAMRRLEQIIYADESDVSPDEQIAGLEELADDYPQFHPVYRHLGNVYNRQNQLDNAIEAYSRCLELSTDLTSMYALARIYVRQGELQLAEELAKKLVSISPDHLPTRVVLAGLAADSRRYDEAAEQYKYIFEADPGYRQPGMPLCALQMVQVYLLAGRGMELPEILNAAIERFPKSPGARAALASFHANQNRMDLAEQVLREGVKLAPEDNAMAANLAILLCQVRDPTSTDKFHEGVMIMEDLCQKSEYRDPELLATLSVLYSMAGRRDDALAAASRARTLAEENGNPGLVQSLDSLMQQQKNAPGKTNVMHPGTFVPGG